MIGAGSFGVVCAGEDTQLVRKIAIKKIRYIFKDPKDAKRTLREIKLLKCIHHPNIIPLVDIIVPDEEGAF